MKTTCTATLIFFLVMMQFCCKIKPKSTEEIARETRDAVVLIKCYNNRDSLFGEGTGFFVSKNEIVTNRHVVELANRVEILSASQNIYMTTYVTGYSKNTDLIKLGVDTRDDRITTINISKREPRIGEKVVVVGSPLGLAGSVSEGIVSAVRSIKEYGNVIQITAPISHGSSGSPVINDIGEVIGVATSYIPRGQNINFALPAIALQDMKSENLLSLKDWNRQFLSEIRERSIEEKIRLANIRSATVWRHWKIYDIRNENVKKQQDSYYDLRGNEIEHIEYDSNEIVKERWTKKYDSDGRFVEMISYDNENSVKRKELNEYDANRNNILSFLITGRDTTKWVKKFNSKGKQIESIWFIPQNKFARRKDFSYDNNIVVSEIFDESGNLTEKIDYRYDDEGNLLEQLSYDQNNNLKSKWYEKYDERGNHVESGGNGMITHKKLFHYNMDGYKVDMTETFYDYFTGKVSSKQFYFFDEFERTIKITTNMNYNLNVAVIYVYDSMGNEIVAKQELNGLLSGITSKKYDKWGNLTETIYMNEDREVTSKVIVSYEYYSD